MSSQINGLVTTGVISTKHKLRNEADRRRPARSRAVIRVVSKDHAAQTRVLPSWPCRGGWPPRATRWCI
jgi:hypothetical protein